MAPDEEATRKRRRASRANPHPYPFPIREGTARPSEHPALRRIPAPPAFGLGNERCDRSSDRFGVILLQEVDADAELVRPGNAQPGGGLLGNERGGPSSARFGVILLQEVDAGAELDEPAIVQLAGELFGKGRGDERARVGGEKELRIGRDSERRVCAVHHRLDVGGLSGDRYLVRNAPGRPPRWWA